MKKLVCLGFMGLVLGAQAQVNNPPLNVFGTAIGSCQVIGVCQYGAYVLATGFYSYCTTGTQPSCTVTGCIISTSKTYSC